MRIWLPIVIAFASACTSGPSKDDASHLLVATTTAVQSAEQKAVTSTQALTAPAVRNLDYIGPCDGEGSFEVKGTVDDTALTYDVQTSFTNCVSVSHVALDGSLHFSPTALTGSISFSDQTTSASCDLDLQFSGTAVTGHVCGYDVKDLAH
jgi:hypothetical protein